MANEIYHRSNWGNAVNDIAWGDTYEKFDATNEMFVRSDNYENSNETDKLMAAINPKPSILLTPTAYDNGSLHSVKPVQTFGSELITNGDFSSGSTGWTSYGTVNISNGIATIGASSNSGIFQAILTQNKSYKVTLNVLSYDGVGNAQVTNDNGLVLYSITQTGLQTFNFKHTISSANIIFRGTSNAVFSIDNVSVKEVTDADFDFTRGSSATRVNEKGLIEDVQILSGNLVQNGDFSQIGSELVTNGSFATDSDWTLGNGSYISGGSLILPNTGTALQTGIPTNTMVRFDVQGSGTITYRVNTGVSFQQISLPQTIYLTTGSSGGRVQFSNTSGSEVTIDNVSVKEVGQNWTFGTGWNMGDDKASCDGTQTSTSTLQTSVGISGIQNNLVSISFELSNYSAGLLDVTLEGSGQIDFNDISSNGVYSAQVTSADSLPKLLFNANADFIGSIDNVSIIKITKDTNLPRIDYTSGTGSLLLEPQSTNLITYSENFTNSYWRKDKMTVTANSIISPTGELNASLIQETSFTSSIPSIDINSPSSLGAGTYTFSFYVKNNNGRYLGISFGSSAERVRTNFDFNTNTFKALNLNGSTTGIASFTTLGNFYRISITATFPSATVADAVLTPLATDTYPFFAFQNSDNRSFYLWGAQVENLSYATSYIPTNGSTVTRLADVCNNAGSSDLINSTEGVLYAEIAALANDGTVRAICISNGTAGDAITIRYSVLLNLIRVEIKDGGVQQFFFQTTSYDFLQFVKLAIKYKANDCKLYINGVQVATDTSATMPSGLNTLNFDSGSGNDDFYGNVKCVAVFKEALSDTELQKLTTI